MLEVNRRVLLGVKVTRISLPSSQLRQKTSMRATLIRTVRMERIIIIVTNSTVLGPKRVRIKNRFKMMTVYWKTPSAVRSMKLISRRKAGRIAG